MRKILFGVLGCLVAACAHAAQVANLDYVHKLIQQKWDISIPIKADNPMLAANMKYLLTAVDVANEILNGEKTTDYGNGEFATLHAADTVATIQAVETLVKKKVEYEFSITVDLYPKTNSNLIGPEFITEFNFNISASGEFTVDWGDGTVETIVKNNTTETNYSHNYVKADVYTIGLSGQATAYSADTTTIKFHSSSVNTVYHKDANAEKIVSIDGSLGAIFGTLPDGSQPRFSGTFYNAYNMTGSIPENLFAGISGAPSSYMFYSTFYNCSGLTGAIPDGLFAGISGAPAMSMFRETFCYCRKLTSIPENLFGNISGTAKSYMFDSTFSDCTSLTGPSARINGQYLYEIWPNAPSSYDYGPYYGCTGLSDYSTMPAVWRSLND